MGAYEHPERKITDRSSSQVHYEVAAGALADAGLSFDDVDGYFCAGDAPGGFAGPGSYGPASMIEYLGIRPRYVDSTETGGSAYIVHAGHAAAAIKEGKCHVALVTMGGSSADGRGTGTGSARRGYEADFGETMYGSMMPAVSYALCAERHMYEFGTTSRTAGGGEGRGVTSTHQSQPARDACRTKVSASRMCVESPMVSSPLHRLDCCAITDGGGAARRREPRDRGGRSIGTCVKILGQGEAPKHIDERVAPTSPTPAAVWSGADSRSSEAGVEPVRHRLRVDLRLLHDHGAR
jgi:acetyl-CoA C-acetyltransferase